MPYVLITPIRNEREHLHNLKESILSQTARPELWVIVVDGNSTDGSYEAAKELFEQYDWVHVIKRDSSVDLGYSHRNFAQAVNYGLEHASEQCLETGMDFPYVGKVDATVVPAADYFEKLMSEMTKDRRLAFSCGIEHLQVDGKVITIRHLKTDRMIGFNDIRLYRSEFLKEMGGYPLSFSPDSILIVKALRRGWDVRIVPGAHYTESRIGGYKIGVWKGYVLKGMGMYFLGYHPVLVVLNAVFNSRLPPHYQGLAMSFGYVSSAIKRSETTADKEVFDFFRHQRPKEVIRILIEKCKGGARD